MAKMEADVEDLEEGKVLAETKHLLADLPAARGGGGGGGAGVGAGGVGGAGAGVGGADEYRRLRGDLLSFDDDEEDGFSERKSAPAPGHSGSAPQKKSVFGSVDLTPYDDRADAGDPEGLVRLLQQRQGELQHAEAGWSAEKQRADRLQAQVRPEPPRRCVFVPDPHHHALPRASSTPLFHPLVATPTARGP